MIAVKAFKRIRWGCNPETILSIMSIPISTSSFRNSVLSLMEMNISRERLVLTAYEQTLFPNFFGLTIANTFTYVHLLEVVNELAASGIYPKCVSDYLVSNVTEAAEEAKDPAKHDLRPFRYHKIALAICNATSNFAFRKIYKFLHDNIGVQTDDEAQRLVNAFFVFTDSEADAIDKYWAERDAQFLTLTYPTSGDMSIERYHHPYKIEPSDHTRSLLIEAVKANLIS